MRPENLVLVVWGGQLRSPPDRIVRLRDETPRLNSGDPLPANGVCVYFARLPSRVRELIASGTGR